MLKDITGLVKIGYQGQLHSTETKRKYADESCKNKKVIEFNVQLIPNHYTNFENVHLCFPIKIKSAVDNDNDKTSGVIPVNNFFTHWITEIYIKRYEDDMPILLLTNTVDIYRYSDEHLKHILKDALKITENDLLYSKKIVEIYGDNNNRCAHYTTMNVRAGNRTDHLKSEYVHRIRLKYLCDVLSIYDSYNAELASTKIKSIKLKNASKTYSSFNSVKFDTSDAHDKYLLYTQFLAWYCKGSSIAPLSDYAHNPIFQEMPIMNQYFTSADEKIFTNLRHGKGYTNETEKINTDDSDMSIKITLKAAAKKKKIACNWTLSR